MKIQCFAVNLQNLRRIIPEFQDLEASQSEKSLWLSLSSFIAPNPLVQLPTTPRWGPQSHPKSRAMLPQSAWIGGNRSGVELSREDQPGIPKFSPRDGDREGEPAGGPLPAIHVRTVRGGVRTQSSRWRPSFLGGHGGETLPR